MLKPRLVAKTGQLKYTESVSTSENWDGDQWLEDAQTHSARLRKPVIV